MVVNLASSLVEQWAVGWAGIMAEGLDLSLVDDLVSHSAEQ